MDAEAPHYEVSEIPLTEWSGSIPTRWWAHDDGRTSVSMRELQVNLPPSKVSFTLARSFGDYKLDYFYPSFIWNPLTVTPSPWASCRCGPTSPPNALDRTWFYPTPDGRRWVANAWIEPDGVTIDALPDLLPLSLPSDAEIDAERKEIQKYCDLGVPEERPRSLMLHDLAKSTKLMELVGDDEFAADFQMFVRHNDFRHVPTGMRIAFSSDDNGAWMLSVLRRYGEDWHDCELYPKSNSIENLGALEPLFRKAGYVVDAPPPIDEESRRSHLKQIATSIPRSIAEHILSRPDLSPVIQLAWAMGHFWSEEDGWMEPDLPLTSPEYQSLQGGHLAMAGEICKLIETGEL